MTSNSKENATTFLENNNLSEVIGFVHAKSSIFGKARHLKRIAKQHKTPIQNILYVGDEVRDIEAARAARAISIGVTWGANFPDALKSAHPDVLVGSVTDLSSAILSYSDA